MPTYDYRCEQCGHAWEKFQSMSAEPMKICPACEQETARRLIGTGAGIIFKGGGFYETDYRSDTYAKDAKKDSGDTKSDGDKAKSGDDKKPDMKADSPKPAETKSEPAPAKAEPAKPAAADTKSS